LANACTAGINATFTGGPNVTFADTIASLPASTIACLCPIYKKHIEECGSMCPEVIKELDNGGELAGVKEACPEIYYSIYYPQYNFPTNVNEGSPTSEAIDENDIMEKYATILATCPKKAEFQICEDEKAVIAEACIFANPKATIYDEMPCFCDINEDFYQECGSMCPEVIKVLDEAGGVRSHQVYLLLKSINRSSKKTGVNSIDQASKIRYARLFA
jgi:hypothetical protein